MEWLCAMHAEARPAKKRVPVPPSLLPPGAPPATFDGDRFLAHIGNNWLDGKVHTRLSSEEMSQVESLGWFGAWRDGVERSRASRAATYQASVAEKVGWLCSMHAEAKPAQKRVPLSLIHI